MTPPALPTLIRIDAWAGFGAGATLLLLKNWLAPLLNLPENLLLAQALTALCYAAFSFRLTRLDRPTRPWVVALATGNAAYAALCALMLWYFFAQITALGVVYFLLDVAVVGGLAWLEWRRIQLDF